MILQFALGASYQNKGYDPVNNPYNKGISTPLTWSFKGTIYQELFANTSIGLGFYHQSNGHTKFPNQGLNSFFGSIKYDFITNIKSNKKETIFEKKQSFWTFSTRYGLGVNALSLDYNHQKPVHVLGIEFAKTHKNTYKFGFGAYYRFYQQYYDYLNQKGAIAVESYPEMLNSPGLYASNFGINGSVEIFLNHFGVFFDLGLNIYKPFYTIDYKLHQTVQGEDGRVPAEQTFYFDLKKAISTRLGLKYYLYKPNIKQNNNFFVSSAINANLGQADFSEISFGYIKILDF